jgi:replicative DNA helicase
VSKSATEGTLVPFSDIHAEGSVISAVLLDPEGLSKIVDFLLPEHFFSEAHRRIFEAARELFFAKDPIDSQTAASWLKARGRLGQVGGIPYIMSILDSTPAPANVRAHAVAIHDAWRRRSVMQTCEQVVIQSATNVADVQSWCEGLVASFGKISLANPIRPVETNGEALERVLRDALGTGVVAADGDEDLPPLTGFPIGLFGLDRILGGLRKSAKTTLVARTGIGKTAMAIQVSVALAKQGVGVLFFSKELKRAELMRRALLQESGVSVTRIKERRLTKSDREALLEANERLKNLPLLIDDTPRLTIEQLSAVSKATKETILHQYRVPLGMIVDDYVQRCEPSRHLLNKDKHEQIGHHSKNFKILCQELDVVGLELAQQKDATPGRKPEKPKGGEQICDSSQIGKEADDIVYLLPDDSAPSSGPDDPRAYIEAWIPKNRAGKKNVGVSLLFRGDTYRFTDPNTPNAMAVPSRQYVAPPLDRFADEHDDDGANPRGL